MILRLLHSSMKFFLVSCALTVPGKRILGTRAHKCFPYSQLKFIILRVESLYKIIEIMKLILLRHGDRSPGFSDVPLSAKGLEQAQALADNSPLLGANKIYCSPKRRALQTIEPLVKTSGISMEITNEVDQMRQIEAPSDFTRRISRFLDSLPRTEEQTVIVCSHSDWLQQAVLLLANEDQVFAPYSFFGCAEFKIFQYESGQWNFLA